MTIISNPGSLPTFPQATHCYQFWMYSLRPFPVHLILSVVKNSPAMQETWGQSLGLEGPMEKEMATHSSILAWKNPIDSEA